VFDWLRREKISRAATVTAPDPDKEFRYDEKAAKDPICKACAQDWPVHVNGNGERMHVDVVGFHPNFGFCQPCPTQNWPDEE
jgi:hypothetical protein